MEPMTFPSGFVKREFVVRTDEMYPQEVKFELYKDKISLVDNYKLNEQVRISFNIKGSQWEGRFFTNLQVHTSSCLSVGTSSQRFDARVIARFDFTLPTAPVVLACASVSHASIILRLADPLLI